MPATAGHRRREELAESAVFAAEIARGMIRETRPVLVLTVRPEPGIDPIRALRWGLKALLRRFGLRVVSIREQHCADDFIERQPIANRDGRRPVCSVFSAIQAPGS